MFVSLHIHIIYCSVLTVLLEQKDVNVLEASKALRGKVDQKITHPE